MIPGTPRNPRLRRVAFWAFGLLLLAGVVFGGTALRRNDAGSGGRDSAVYLAEQASAALASNDDTAALAFANRALAVDPANAEALRVADEVARRRAASPEPPPSDTTGGAAPDAPADSGDEAFSQKIPNLVGLLPTGFAGYSLGAPSGLGDEAVVSATPKSGDVKVTTIVWSVHDAGSAKEADRFIERTSTTLYGSDRQRVTIDGASAYVGTDGMRYASAVYVRGRYVFEVLLSGTDGAPAGYRSTAVEAAKAFEDSPSE